MPLLDLQFRIFCKVKKMGTEKKPLSKIEYDAIRAAALRKDANSSGKSYETLDGRSIGENEIVILLLRYTGMHVSILSKPEEYNLHVKDNMIIWNRTKKEGREAYTSIPVHKDINFNVQEYIENLKKRKRRISRQYFHALVKELGERAGIQGVSPMSFRHTLAVDLLEQGYPDAFVMQVLNCSHKSFKSYSKYTDARKRSMFEKMGWCR